jgi:hypothetical protein
MHEARDKNVKNAAILPTDIKLLVSIYDNATNQALNKANNEFPLRLLRNQQEQTAFYNPTIEVMTFQ